MDVLARRGRREASKGINLADVVTGLSAFAGMLAIMYFVDGDYQLGSRAIVVAVLLDGLDGMIARRLSCETERGAYMDLVSDMISFCLAPAVMVYSAFYDLSAGSSWQYPPNMFVMMACSGLVIGGLYHLSRNVKGKVEKGYFDGLPTPVTALIVVGFFLWNGSFVGSVFGALAASLLMVSRVPYPEIRGKWRVLSGFVVVSMVFTVGTGFFLVPFGILLVGYVVGGPVYWRYCQLR